jgi:hypothetical protein
VIGPEAGQLVELVEARYGRQATSLRWTGCGIWVKLLLFVVAPLVCVTVSGHSKQASFQPNYTRDIRTNGV